MVLERVVHFLGHPFIRYMFEGNFGLATSTSGLKTTDPFRDGPGGRAEDTGDCGVTEPLTEDADKVRDPVGTWVE